MIMYKIKKRKYENEFTISMSVFVPFYTVDYNKKKRNKKDHNINKLVNFSHFSNLCV